MKYIISAKTKYGKELIKSMRSGGAEVIEFTNVSDLLKLENKKDYIIIFDTYNDDAEILMNGGFSVEFDVASEDQDEEGDEEIFDGVEKQMELMKANLKDAMKSGSMKRILEAIESIRDIIKDPQPLVDSLRKNIASELSLIQDKFKTQVDEVKSLIQKGGESYNSLLPKIKSIESQIDDIISGFDIKTKSIEDNVGNCVVGVSETKKQIDVISKELNVILKQLVSKLTPSDLKPIEGDIKSIKKEIEDIWKELKNVFAFASRGAKDIVQGTTRLMLFLEGVSLNDTFNELDFQEGSGITLAKSLDSTNRRTVLTIAAPGSTTDEKVKLSASDPTAGYLQAKLDEGITGMKAKDSAGMAFKGSGGTTALEIGAGGGNNATFYDGVKLNAGTASRVLVSDADKNISYATMTASDLDAIPTTYAKLTNGDQVITAEQIRTVGDVAITYDGDFVDEITIGDRTVAFSNDGTDYTSWADDDYTWTPTYTGGKLTALTIS